MIKLKSEDDVRRLFSDNLIEEENGKYYSIKADFSDHSDNEEFQMVSSREDYYSGAVWAFNANKEYVEFLLNKIEKLKKKTEEYADKITSYEEMLYGIDVPAGKSKGKKKVQKIEPDEVGGDDVMSVFASVFGDDAECDDDWNV